MHPRAFVVQTSFVFVSYSLQLIVARLFISTQWDTRRVSAGERFGAFAVSVEAAHVLKSVPRLSCKIGSAIFLRFQRHYMYLHKCKYCIFTQITSWKNFKLLQDWWKKVLPKRTKTMTFWKMRWALHTTSSEYSPAESTAGGEGWLI